LSSADQLIGLSTPTNNNEKENANGKAENGAGKRVER
jgi:hypothetical protein